MSTETVLVVIGALGVIKRPGGTNRRDPGLYQHQ